RGLRVLIAVLVGIVLAAINRGSIIIWTRRVDRNRDLKRSSAAVGKTADLPLAGGRIIVPAAVIAHPRITRRKLVGDNNIRSGSGAAVRNRQRVGDVLAYLSGEIARHLPFPPRRSSDLRGLRVLIAVLVGIVLAAINRGSIVIWTRRVN